MDLPFDSLRGTDTFFLACDSAVHLIGQYMLYPPPADQGYDYDPDDSEIDSDLEEDEDDLMDGEFGQYDPSIGLPGGELTEALYGDDSEDDSEDEDASKRFVALFISKLSSCSALCHQI